eukprot:TCONS_00053059-protein
MNAIIALCHFCEAHGPSILFCTQPFHCQNHTPNDIRNGVAPSPSLCGITYKRHNSDSSVSEATNESPEKPKSSTIPKPSTCEGCRSIEPGQPGYISIDREYHISYISSQHPDEPELFAVLRHACVRSLSCEVCPGREGPIMFGDESSGYVFSHTFHLKDLQSRGFQRWYSLICVMMDRIFLVNSWQFLISNFKGIIDELQHKSERVYKEEQSSSKGPQSAEVLLHQPRNTLYPDQFRRVGQVYRSLADITKDTDVFQYLHKMFGWILKAGGIERYTEKVLVGPPVEEYLLDENNQGETEFDKEIHDLLNDQNEDGPIFQSLIQMHKILGNANFLKMAYHVVRGDQLVVRGKYKRTAASVLETAKFLVPAGCVQGCRYHEPEYVDSFRCNFLGLQEEAQVPDHVLESDLFVLVDITTDKEEIEKSTVKSHFSSIDSSFDGTVFTVAGADAGKEPTYLKHVIQALKDETINDKVFQLILVTLKEQWMGKVKVMFKFSKTGMRTKDDKQKLLNILDATVDDEILLKYWMTSLSQSYRTHLLETSSSSSQDSKETT